MKKFLVLFVIILTSVSFAFADPIMELAAPRMQPKAVGGDSSVAPKTKAKSSASKKSLKNKPGKKSHKIRKRIQKPKPKVVIVDYSKISRMIEYGYYDDADKFLEGAIARNSKDVQALSLQSISLAKQFKLDPAQDELNVLLKKYPDNSNLHYAQGIVDYQRTSSSNMVYRNNIPKLFADAQKEFKKAISLDKNNARAYNALGVVAVRLNNLKDATKYFQKALAIDKTYSLAIDNLGTMDYTAGKIKDAEKKFKQSLLYNSQNTTAMYHLAQIAYQKGDYNKALSYLNDAAAINTNSPAIYNLLGKAYSKQGNEAAAINSLKKSITVKPEFVLSYFDLANIYEKRGDNAIAIELLKTAVAIDSNYCDAKLKIADLSLLEGNYKQSISFYAQLVGVDGYNDEALKGLANAYFGVAQTSASKASLGSNKDLYKALDYINKAITANNNDLELHLAKLKLSKITNQPAQAKMILDQIVKAPGGNLMNMVVKGEAYMTMNDYKNAQIAFASALILSKNTDDDLYLSEILVYHQQYDLAQKVLQKILSTNPQNQQALSSMDYIQKNKKAAANYFQSAQKFLSQNNKSMAFEYLSRSLAVNPNNAQAHLLLAQLYEKQRDYQNASANYRAYLSLSSNPINVGLIKRKIKKLEKRIKNL